MASRTVKTPRSPRRRSPERHLPVFSEAIPSKTSAIEPLVQRVSRKLTSYGCVDGHGAAVELALREALSNAILHGNQQQPRKRVRVECFRLGDNSTLLVVRDQGSGFDPSAVADPTLPENLFRETGRGIYLIRQFMDEVHFAHGGREIRMRKKH